MQLFLPVATIFYVTFISVATCSALDSRESLLIPLDSPLETQFTNPPTTRTENTRPGGRWKRAWEDFNFHRWLFPPTQPKQLDFFRLRASELPTFLSVRTLPASAWEKSANSILRNGELISPESANIQNDYLVVEVLES